MKSKQDNILNERPRKANNKIDGTKVFCENLKQIKKEKEMNFVQAFIILLLTVFAFAVLFPLAQRAMDRWALRNCEVYGDCVEVLNQMNGR